jgi:hypothetical protein
VRIDQAQTLAADWVRSHDFGRLPVAGAFLAGSTIEADGAAELAPESDVDVAVVVDGPAPAKLGKLDVSGVRVEVTYLPWSDLVDPERVARIPHLAPSFARDTVLADRDGRLRRLQAQVGPLFARPDVVEDRCTHVLDRMAAAPAPTVGWPQAVTGWLFPTSLATHVVLVAARRNPTVRLRYLRAREVLHERGLGDHYPALLAQLGCLEVTPSLVTTHLAALTDAFDAAAGSGPTSFFFASDITAAARPIAIDGTAGMVARGEHREAVFWLLATFSRCLQILDATDATGRARHHDTFAAAVSDLVGLSTPEDLRRRRAEVLAGLPRWRALAGEIVAQDLRSTGTGRA